MSDVKTAVLNAPGRALRFLGSLAVLALLQIVLLAAGPMPSAQAEDVVTCTVGDGLIDGADLLQITFDVTTGACVLSEVNAALPNPDNGLKVIVNPANPFLQVTAARYENGVYLGNVSGADFSITNYTGTIADGGGFVDYEDNIPDAAGSSAISFTTLINGSPVTFNITGITKTDNTKDMTYTTVTFTYTGGPSAADKSNIANHLLSSFNKVGGGVFGPGGIPMGIANGTSGGAGFAFTPNGGGNAGSGITFGSQADAINPMDRDYGFLTRGGGYAGLSGQPPARSGKGFNFSFNLQNMIANRRKSEQQALGANGLKDGPYEAASRWNAWTLGRYTDFEDDRANADLDGHLWSITSGLSFALGQHTMVGAFTRMRQGEVDSTALDASLDSDFFGGGVYLVTTLSNGVRIMGAGLIENGDNKIVISGDTGSFDTDQKTLEARIDRRFTKGHHWVEPAIKVLYSDMDRAGFTDSSGAAVAASDTSLGRLTFGPSIGTTIHSGGTTLKPFARINGVWDFKNEDNFTLSTGVVVSNDNLAVNLGGGLEIAFHNGVVVTGAVDWLSFDSDFDAVSMTGSIGMPLSAFGMGGSSAGLVSLDFAGREDQASAKARLRIPLGQAAK